MCGCDCQRGGLSERSSQKCFKFFMRAFYAKLPGESKEFVAPRRSRAEWGKVKRTTEGIQLIFNKRTGTYANSIEAGGWAVREV